MNDNPLSSLQPADTPGRWQPFLHPGEKPVKRFLPPTSQWEEGWPQAWSFSSIIGAIVAGSVLAGGGFALTSVLIALSAFLVGVLFVPTTEKVWARGRYKEQMASWQKRTSPVWEAYGQRAHGDGGQSKPYPTFAVQADRDIYRLLEFAADDERVLRYRVLLEEKIDEELLVAVERGAELAEIARALEEKTQTQWQKEEQARKADEQLKADSQLESNLQAQTREQAIREAVGYKQQSG
jgi:hypothetical protein